MRFYTTLLATAPLLMTARADIDLDLDDTPRECRDICRPVAELADRCHTDLRGDDNDREEDLLEAQCFCTNDSFNVGAVSALCRDCIRQNSRRDDDTDDDDDDHDHDDHHRGDDDWDDDHDHDDHHTKRDDDHDDAWNDINDIVRTCGFSSTSWSPSATTSVAVSASRPTDASQLTTTFSAAAQTGNNSPQETNGADNSNNNDSNNSNNNGDDDGAAAGIVAPVFMAGALVVGAAALLM